MKYLIVSPNQRSYDDFVNKIKSEMSTRYPDGPLSIQRITHHNQILGHSSVNVKVVFLDDFLIAPDIHKILAEVHHRNLNRIPPRLAIIEILNGIQ